MPKKRTHPFPTVPVTLSREEVDDLVRLSGYYQRSMGVMRHIVRLTAGGPTRRRFKFVAEESKYLLAFAESVRSEMTAETIDAQFTPRTLVAFWGRALSSLNSKRSRRRLSAVDIERREILSDKFRRAVERLWLKDPELAEAEIATRRTTESDWMREALSLTDHSSVQNA
jgi:hypothetical protein